MWYRLLKVFFIIISIGSLLITFFITYYNNESNTHEKYLSRDQMQELLDSRPKGVSLDEGLKMYIDNGWTIQGVNESKLNIGKEALVYLSVNLFILIIIQRTFYYIVLGTVRPK
jgi:hypothetical protein